MEYHISCGKRVMKAASANSAMPHQTFLLFHPPRGILIKKIKPKSNGNTRAAGYVYWVRLTHTPAMIH